MKILKENGGVFIEDIVMKPSLVENGRIRKEVVEKLERIASERGWFYSPEYQTIFMSNGNGLKEPLVIFSERRAYVRTVDNDAYKKALAVVKKFYQNGGVKDEI